jgi:hypothetical protein
MRANAHLLYCPAMRQPFRVLVVVGVLVVAGVAAWVIRGSFEMPVRERASRPDEALHETPAPEDPGEDVVARALRLAAIDTTKKKAWVEDIPDLDLDALAPAARANFLRIANGRSCTCGCGFTLAGCRRFDSECEYSGPRAAALYDSVRSGKIADAQGFPPRPNVR